MSGPYAAPDRPLSVPTTPSTTNSPPHDDRRPFQHGVSFFPAIAEAPDIFAPPETYSLLVDLRGLQTSRVLHRDGTLIHIETHVFPCGCQSYAFLLSVKAPL